MGIIAPDLRRSFRSLEFLAHSASPTEPRPLSLQNRVKKTQKTKPSKRTAYDTSETVFLMTLNNQIAEYDAVLVAKARARQDHCCEAGVSQMDGDTGWNQHGVTGMNFYRTFNAGAQIKAG